MRSLATSTAGGMVPGRPAMMRTPAVTPRDYEPRPRSLRGGLAGADGHDAHHSPRACSRRGCSPHSYSFGPLVAVGPLNVPAGVGVPPVGGTTATTLDPDPPTIQNLDPPAVEGVASAGAWVSADAGVWDPPEGPAFSYQWRRCDGAGEACEAIAGATDEVYRQTSADIGATLRVAVTAALPGTEASASSDATAVIGAGVTNSTGPMVGGDARVGRVLTAQPGEWTSGQGDVAYEYQWQRCDPLGDACADVDGADDAWYWLQPDDAGSTLRVSVTANDGSSDAAAMSDPTAIVEDAAAGESPIPTISGTAQEDAELDADPGGLGAASSWWDYTFQWLRCDADGVDCDEIADATAQAYYPTTDDVGSTVRVRVSAPDGSGGTTLDVSDATDVIVSSGRPATTTVPTVEGVAREGSALEVDAGAWTGAPNLAYQWYRCDDQGESCVEVPDATDSIYVLRAGDAGSSMQAVVIAQNEHGSTVVQTDASDPVVEPLDESPVAVVRRPVVHGRAQVGEELHAGRGRWSGAPESFTYQWQACDQLEEQCSDIEGADDRVFQVRTGDVDGLLRVVVTATNAQGSLDANPSRPRPSFRPDPTIEVVRRSPARRGKAHV